MRKVNVSNSLRKLFSIIMVSIFIIAAMPVDTYIWRWIVHIEVE